MANSGINRVQAAFDREGTRLVGYLVGGDPNLQTTLACMHAMARAGVDLIEIGIPFTDPQADGAEIQLGHVRALESGTALPKMLAMVEEFRTTNSTTPVLLMGYMNTLVAYGEDRFVVDALAAGVDGAIIVDQPIDTATTAAASAFEHDFAWVRLTAPTTSPQRIDEICRAASGFVYHVSGSGTTGGFSIDTEAALASYAMTKRATTLPVALGFGIRTAEQAKAFAGKVDAIVVGTALVRTCAENTIDTEERILHQCSLLASALQPPSSVQ